jgi:RNA polymerase sigma factor, sigma-70 family
LKFLWKKFAEVKHFAVPMCIPSEGPFKTQGDRSMTEQQFSPLAARYMDTVFRVAYSYLRSPADADDVTQDVLIQLYKTDKAFDDDAHVKNWLIRVTVNRCKNVLRAPWHRTEDIADYENSLSFEEPQCHELFDAVMALDRRYRVPVLLYYYEGYRQKEIAGLLDIPEETVRTRLARAREKLKHILSEVPQT